jgi:hypothetical protein
MAIAIFAHLALAIILTGTTWRGYRGRCWFHQFISYEHELLVRLSFLGYLPHAGICIGEIDIGIPNNSSSLELYSFSSKAIQFLMDGLSEQSPRLRYRSLLMLASKLRLDTRRNDAGASSA